MTWIPCDEVVEGDVVRFTESVWERRGPRRKQRVVRVGQRTVTAQVLSVEEQWVYLLVMECSGDVLLGKDEEIKRKITTVLKTCDRLLWSEEPVRAQLTSRFLREANEEEGVKPRKR